MLLSNAKQFTDKFRSIPLQCTKEMYKWIRGGECCMMQRLHYNTQSKLMSMLTLYFIHVGLSTLELCPHFYGTIFCRIGCGYDHIRSLKIMQDLSVINLLTIRLYPNYYARAIYF